MEKFIDSQLDKSIVQKYHDFFWTMFMAEIINETILSSSFGSSKIKFALTNDNCEPVLIFLYCYKYRSFIRHFINFRDLSDSDVWLINRAKDSIKI